MSREVKLLVRKLGLFAIPFVLYSLVIIVVDPYDFFDTPSPVPDERKLEISYKLNYAMWKMLRFEDAPQPNILLGDSRMMAMRSDTVFAAVGERYYNFSYGGGSLKEAIATFHYARNLVDLEKVYFGLTLDTYNGSDVKNRTGEVVAAQRNPLLYIVNNNVLLSTFRILRAELTGRSPHIGQPVGDKGSFWQRQLEQTARLYFGGYQDPEVYRQGLAEIAEICDEEGIELGFILFPTHMDLQDKIGEYGLTEQDHAMRTDLARWGVVYDFAWDNAFTRDRDQFRDPYHFGPALRDIIIESVWGTEKRLVRISGPDDRSASRQP